jgi:hypothetical protein
VTTVASVARIPTATDGAGAFARALRNPRVVGVAKSLNIDLTDPGALNALLDRTRKLVESSTQVTLGARATVPAAGPGIAPESIPDSYVRNAIRTYQSVSRLI